MKIADDKMRSFATPAALRAWLRRNHAREAEVWIKFFRKSSGVESISWEEAVIEAIAWGWIDAVMKPLDDTAWLHRFTPRKPGSAWSKKNCRHAERLIASGRMQPAGMTHVEAARADGRWDKAYAGQSDFQMPADFVEAVAKNPAAQAMFETLNRKNLFALYYRLHTAKKPETRQRRMDDFVAMLARGEKLH